MLIKNTFFLKIAKFTFVNPDTYTSDSFSLLILPLLLRQLHKEYLKYRLELFLVFISYKIKEILGWVCGTKYSRMGPAKFVGDNFQKFEVIWYA